MYQQLVDKLSGLNYFFPAIPQNLYTLGMDSVFQADVWREIQEIIGYYSIVENGAPFQQGNLDDFTGSDLHYKIIRRLLYKEARFMASKPLEFVFNVRPKTDSKTAKDAAAQIEDDYTTILRKLLNDNRFDSKFTKAVKDCLIGKRVALVANFNPDGVQIDFLPSLEFTAEYDAQSRRLVRFVAFYSTVESADRNKQRIYRKVYEMVNGICHITEGLYDGSGNLIESYNEDLQTLLDFIPVVIILNDGLTGETKGESEVNLLADSESWFSRMANNDLDAERKGMNPIRYIVDAESQSTKDLSCAPGALWDITSSADAIDKQAQIGLIESGMTYSSALTETLKRIKNDMYDQLGVPDVTLDSMVGNITSGKGMRAVYWDLIVRIEEKMLSWKPELEEFVRKLFEGCRLYPEFLAVHVPDIKLPVEPFDLVIENRYPIMEDETEEKSVDLMEVNAQVMSRKTYMKKWRGLTDDEVDEELKQIALEREITQDSYNLPMSEDYSNIEDKQEQEEKAEGEER